MPPVLQDIFAHTEETFGGSAHMWHNHLIQESEGDLNKPKQRAPQPQASKDASVTTQHKMKEEEVSLATMRGDADGDLHEEASSLLGEDPRQIPAVSDLKLPRLYGIIWGVRCCCYPLSLGLSILLFVMHFWLVVC